MPKSTNSAQSTVSILHSQRFFSAAVVLGFLLLGGVTMYYHEMWRDELQTWMTVRHCQSLSELMVNKKYDGHPILWYLFPYFASKFTNSFVSMQIIHLLIAAGTVWLITRYSPFSRLQKVLLSFGYFTLYEYAVITRDYAIGIFLLVLFLAFYEPLRKPGWLLPCLLAICAQANAYSLMLSAWLGGFYYFTLVRTRRERPAMSRKDVALLATGAIIFAAGIVWSAVQLIPPAGSWVQPAYLGYNADLAGKVLTIIWKSYVPIPSNAEHFWHTNIVTSSGAQMVLSAGLGLFFLLALARKPLIAVSYGAATLVLLMFSYTRYFGYMRHHGHLFIVLVMCMWLYIRYPAYASPNGLFARVTGRLQRAAVRCFTVLLVLQVVAGVFACVSDWVYPFSASKAAAEYLVKEKLADKPIAGCLDYVASAVGARLDRPIYFPQNDRTGTFLIFDGPREESLRRLGASPEFLNVVLGNSYKYMMSQKQDILLLLSFSLGRTPPMIAPIKEFTESVQPDEIYFLYWMKYPGPSQ